MHEYWKEMRPNGDYYLQYYIYRFDRCIYRQYLIHYLIWLKFSEMGNTFCKTNDVDKEIIVKNSVVIDEIDFREKKFMFIFETFWSNLLPAWLRPWRLHPLYHNWRVESFSRLFLAEWKKSSRMECFKMFQVRLY